MELAPFYYWMFGIFAAVGLVVLFNFVFNKKVEKPTYNFRDEKRVREMEISEDLQLVYELMVNRFRDNNVLKLKKLEVDSYDLEARSITSLLDGCESKKEVFMLMDEEFYRWNWSSPLYDEFYEVLMNTADEVWEMIKKD